MNFHTAALKSSDSAIHTQLQTVASKNEGACIFLLKMPKSTANMSATSVTKPIQAHSGAACNRASTKTPSQHAG
jgi:hypothetical protein